MPPFPHKGLGLSRLSARSALQSVSRFEVSTGDPRPSKQFLDLGAGAPKSKIRQWVLAGYACCRNLSLILLPANTTISRQLFGFPLRRGTLIFQSKMPILYNKIAAHNYRTHFGPLSRITVGDRVTFTDLDGNVFYYQVAEVQVLKPTAIEEMVSDDWDLSLFTCTLGGQTRLTVRCEKEDASDLL